jgi:hypothetical protein
MKYFVIITFCLFAFTKGIAQDMNKKVLDEKSNTQILIGNCDRGGLMGGDFGNSYNLEWNTYVPNNEAVNSLKYHLEDIGFTIVLGTWCSDSKTQVPRFIRLLDVLKYDVEQVKFIAVDRSKTAPGIPMADLKIEKVPTIIVKRDNKEIGRITETPAETLEIDLVNIINMK